MTHRMYGSDGALLKAMEYTYTYGDPAKGEIPDSLYKYEIGSDIDLTFTYDNLARLTHRNLITDSINKTESYTYKASERGGTYTTTLVESMTDLAGVQHVYTYDANGNILSDTYGGYTVSYEYDSLNRMTRYNDPVYGWTYVYVYDNRGNITEMHEHHYTAGDLGEPLNVYEYEYGDSIWADLLTSYWGEEISYDELGNPQNWIWGETLRWQNGRQLVSYDDSVNYTYNADGLRTGKSGDRTTEYYIVNGTYIGETTTIGTVQYRIIYLYDETGSVCGLEVTKIDGNTITTDTYYFAKNLQGDVTAILDAQGNVVANYRYDAYGAIISVTDANGNNISSATHIANLNPFRYRGYMYDEESGFYYLRSRYYDPYIGRFLNADGLVSTGVSFDGFNMFAYCNSNPINFTDYSGNRPIRGTDACGIGISSSTSKAEADNNNSANQNDSFFGAEATTSATIYEFEDDIWPDPFPVTIKYGSNIVQTLTSHGDSSRPISVYANGDTSNYLTSSAGVNINIFDFTLNACFALDNIGLYGSIAKEDTVSGLGLKIDLTQIKFGIEQYTSVSWDNTTQTTYNNASISGWVLYAAYVFATTGQWIQAPVEVCN